METVGPALAQKVAVMAKVKRLEGKQDANVMTVMTSHLPFAL